jgi:hypothetical protein
LSYEDEIVHRFIPAWKYFAKFVPVVWHGGVPHNLTSLLDPVISSGWEIVRFVQVNNSGLILADAVSGGLHRAAVLRPVP